MTSPFDASLVFNGVLGDDVIAAQQAEVERSMPMLSALSNAKLHATRDMERWVMACNRLIWGEVPQDLRPPSAEEATWLLEQLEPERRERLLREAKLAAEQRHLVGLLTEAEGQAHALLEAQHEEQARFEAEAAARFEAEQAEHARAQAEAQLREEFEAVDEAGKEARFQAWRASKAPLL